MDKRLHDSLFLHELEGEHVSVALTDGSRHDDCLLMGSGYSGAGVWLRCRNGENWVNLDELEDITPVSN